jgi:hypothetical protein
MQISTTVSLGEVVTLLAVLATFLYNYFSLSWRQKAVEDDIGDLKRGRGLILGPTSDWPPMVLRCFGMRNGNLGDTHRGR